MNFKSRLASLHNSCPFTTAQSLDLLFECINHSLAIKFMSKKKRCTIASSSFLPAWKFSQFLIQPSSFSSFWRFPSQTPGSLMAVFHKLSCVHKMKLLEILAKHRSCFPNVWVEARDFPFLISFPCDTNAAVQGHRRPSPEPPNFAISGYLSISHTGPLSSREGTVLFTFEPPALSVLPGTELMTNVYLPNNWKSG